MDQLIVKILIVDDVEANLLSFSAILAKEKLQILEANSGSAALKILMKEDIDIVLLDVQMPDINGFEVAQLMRENKRTMNIPIIFITAISKEEQYMFKGYELGAVDYLYKPISNDLLRSKVKVFVKLQLQSKIIEIKSNELEIKIMELEKVKKELHNLTCTDQLTEITNRRGFDEAFGLAWRRAIRNGSSVTLLMIDIDNFKNYNDTYGHVEGDVCLKKVARRIADTLLRPFDQVARYGGEEFVVLLPETDLNGGEKIAEDIRHNIETMNIENKKDGTSDVVTVSIGVASVIPGAGDEKESLTKWADGAMYQAKESGRNRCCFYVNQH